MEDETKLLHRQISSISLKNDIDLLRRQISQRLEIAECRIAANTSARRSSDAAAAGGQSSSWTLNDNNNNTFDEAHGNTEKSQLNCVPTRKPTTTMEDETKRIHRQISSISLQHDVDRIRRQISQRLESAECRIAANTSARRSSVSAAAGGQSSSWTLIDNDHTFNEENNNTEESQPQQQQESSRQGGSGTKYKKGMAFIVGLAILAGIVVAIIAVKDFMESGDIQFVRDDPGTAAITTEELARHNSTNDCWVVFYGNVYDLTNYARRHPGGASFVTDLGGVDGTVEYEFFHSEALLRSVQGEIVGTLTTTA
jgi:cytochrome b involved in lipid metabolism